jgi:hypothetical protein
MKSRRFQCLEHGIHTGGIILIWKTGWKYITPETEM